MFGASGDPCEWVLSNSCSADLRPYYIYINTHYEDMHKVIDKIIQGRAKGILVVPAWQCRHWYAALARITKASYLVPLRALKMWNHPDVPMQPRHFPHLACLLDGSLIPSVDFVGHSSEPALASAGSLLLSDLINNVACCTLFDNHRQCAQTLLAALTRDTPRDIVCTWLHHLTRPQAHTQASAVRSAADDSISGPNPPELSDSASDSASDSDTASFHSV